MKVRIPLLIKDRMSTQAIDIEPTEGKDFDEPFFLDGPVSRRVAVLDFDADTGALAEGAKFVPPNGNRVLGRYALAHKDNLEARDFNQVCVFGTVLKTMAMFEEPDTLGRPLTWAFGAPQLLVVPRAGEMANAYYERDSHSLQFFYFPNPDNAAERVYSSHSQDIVSHETGHAILDGIAPDLYNAITPQSLAMHEAIADLTALLIAFRSHTLSEAVLDKEGGTIASSRAFSGIAKQFGVAFSGGGSNYLRELSEFKTLEPGHEGFVAEDEPHDLSQVLSNTLYSVMLKIFEQTKAEEIAAHPDVAPFSLSGKAFFKAAERFKRITLRGLDYLPPGDATFADYGRAMLAADQASHPDDEQVREWLRDAFVERQIVPDEDALAVETNVANEALRDLDLQTLAESNWAAFEFANLHREFLGIPPEKPFEVRPRLDVTKHYYHRDSDKPTSVRELIFKVSWDEEEPNPPSSGLPERRQYKAGSTLAIDWDSRNVRARLSTGGDRGQSEQRTALLRQLMAEDLLQFGAHAYGPDGKELRSAIRAESIDGLMRVRGAARMLHAVRAN